MRRAPAICENYQSNTPPNQIEATASVIADWYLFLKLKNNSKTPTAPSPLSVKESA
jgi:hypothetical protein